MGFVKRVCGSGQDWSRESAGVCRIGLGSLRECAGLVKGV